MNEVHETRNNLPIRTFATAAEWNVWLDTHHAASAGVWLRLAKKSADFATLSYAEALDIALWYGWIDGQKGAYDDSAWVQKFTPRGARSIWSRINREKVERFIAEGRMQPAGLAAVERARQNGQWDNAYDSARSMTVPDDFLAALAANPLAEAAFAALNATNRYAMLFRIQTAKKPETRLRRIEQLVAMLARGEKLYP